jgi:hypothetical protein
MLVAVLFSLLLLAAPAAAQQEADPDFHPSVAHPAFAAGRGPVVLIDEAHQNFHRAGGRYAPFAELLGLDGFVVRPSAAPFTASALAGTRVLVIANALGPGSGPAAAFSPDEVAAVRLWVERGGALLLIADHAPFGTSAEPLAEAFGVRMGQGYAFSWTPAGPATIFEYDAASRTLGDHAIVRGRNPSETVRRLRAFTGQSLTVPAGATNLMILPPGVREAADVSALNAIAQAGGEGGRPVAGPSQGLAMRVRRGRVVIVGEAAMFSAQVLRQQNPARTIRAGMNVPGIDNQQFALNIVRWLAGTLN